MGRRRRRPWPVLAAVGVATVALFIWSLTVVAGPTGRRSITVLCSSIETLCQQWALGFTRRSGIEVLMVRLPTGEALARLSRPASAGEFDVWHGGPSDMYVVAQSRGLLAPYLSPEAGSVAAQYRDPDGWWTGAYLGVLGFCSNKRLLDELGLGVPRSWDDLLAPALRHRVSLPSPVTSGTGYTWLSTQVQRLGGEQAALAYARALDPQVLQYTSSGLAPAGVVGRGEAVVAVTFTQHCVRAADAGMSDLVVSYPREGTGFEIGAVAVLAHAADPDAAHAYVDWAMSREAQTAGSGAVAVQLPTRDDVPSDARLEGGALLITHPNLDPGMRERLVEAFQTQVHR